MRVKFLESLEYGDGDDSGLDVVEYNGRVCMMEYDRGGSLGNILEYKNGKWGEYDGDLLWGEYVFSFTEDQVKWDDQYQVVEIVYDLY